MGWKLAAVATNTKIRINDGDEEVVATIGLTSIEDSNNDFNQSITYLSTGNVHTIDHCIEFSLKYSDSVIYSPNWG